MAYPSDTLAEWDGRAGHQIDRHLCALYGTEREKWRLLASFYRKGLEEGRKMVFIGDGTSREALEWCLRVFGMDANSLLGSGQFRLLDTAQTYVRDGKFSMERMLGLLDEEIAQTKRDGFSGLMAAGEMIWATRGYPGGSALIEYEARLNDFLSQTDCNALCLYDRRRFSPALLLYVLATHPVVAVGTRVYDNPYYMVPPPFLSTDNPKTTLAFWLSSLADADRR